MALYRCGWCDRMNEDDIWCSEEHRKLWYAKHGLPYLDKGSVRPQRRGPQGKTTGGTGRERKPQDKKS